MRLLYFLLLVPVIIFASFFTLGRSETREEQIENKIRKLKSKFEVLESKYQELNKEMAELPQSRYFDVTSVCEGRLTTESGAPISVSDRTSQSTLYFALHHGDTCSLYDGSTWELFTFTEISLALSGLTTGKNYDVFLYSNAGTLTLELSAEWTNDTTRADAISLQNGIYVKTGATSHRFLGTIRATSATTTEDSKSKRFVWNYMNRRPTFLQVIDSTNSWSYANTAWQAANATAGNKVEYVVGLNEDVVTAKVLGIATASSGALNYASVGVGVDSATVNSATMRGSGTEATTVVQVWGEYAGHPGLGYHYLQWLEAAHATGITFYGDNGDGTKFQSGLLAEIRN